MKITLFGATGALGTECLRQCLEAQHEVTVLAAQPNRYLIAVNISDDFGQSAQVSFFQSVHAALTTNRPAVSQSVVYYYLFDGNDRIWNVNPDNNSVSVFDLVTGAKLAEIPVGQNPRSLAIAPSGRV